MRNRWLAAVLCLVTVTGLIVSLGCSPERNARRARVMAEDLHRLPDDIDWALGLDEASIIYEDTAPPFPNK